FAEKRANSSGARAHTRRGRGGRAPCGQAAQGLDRAVHPGRPAGLGRQRKSGACNLGRLSPEGNVGRGAGGGDPFGRRGKRLLELQGCRTPHERAHVAPPRPGGWEAGTGDRAADSSVTAKPGSRENKDEIEIKLPCKSLDAVRQRLREGNAAAVSPLHFESNDLFDNAAGQIAGSGSTLRLRQANNQALLTFKGPARFEGGV